MAAWPAVALVGSYELLMMVIRNAQAPAGEQDEAAHPDDLATDPLHEEAMQVFANDLAANAFPLCVQSVLGSRSDSRGAQRIRGYLAAINAA